MTITDYKKHFEDSYTKQESGCWTWDKCYDFENEPKCTADPTHEREQIYIHRLAYIYEHGSIPDKTKVLHTCKKWACVNPAHLYLYRVECITPKGTFTNQRQAAKANRLTYIALTGRLNSPNYLEYYTRNKYK